jgi:hypothetical protein
LIDNLVGCLFYITCACVSTACVYWPPVLAIETMLVLMMVVVVVVIGECQRACDRTFVVLSLEHVIHCFLHHLLLHIHDLGLALEFHHDGLHCWEVHCLVHACQCLAACRYKHRTINNGRRKQSMRALWERKAYARNTLHGTSHGCSGFEGLDSQIDGLQVRAHLIELLYLCACAYQVLGHDTRCTLVVGVGWMVMWQGQL